MPPPGLERGSSFGTVYVGNVIFGSGQEQVVNSSLAAAAEALGNQGLPVHEQEPAALDAAALGLCFDGEHLRVS
eukprot:14722196-Alexandrium_andersonii.AAC.1